MTFSTACRASEYSCHFYLFSILTIITNLFFLTRTKSTTTPITDIHCINHTTFHLSYTLTLFDPHISLQNSPYQDQYSKVRDLHVGAVILTFDYEMAMGILPKGLGKFFGAIQEAGLSSTNVVKGENYILLECKFCTDLKIQKNLCLKINI